MELRIHIDRKFYKILDESPKFISRAMDDALPKIALMVEGEAKKNFNGINQLRVRTGNLRRSIIGAVKGNVVSVGTDVVYGRIHELGGIMPGGWKMPKRPYLAPAFDENENKIEKILMKELRQEWEKQ